MLVVFVTGDFVMLAIIDNSGTPRGIKLREFFIRSGIPCSLCVSEDVVRQGNMVISFDDDVSETDNELVIRADGKAFGNSIRRRAEISRLMKCAENLLSNKFGFNIRAFRAGRFLVKDSYIYVCGTPLRLTAAERCILFCLSFCENEWTDAVTIAQHCMISGSAASVRVHIFNLNEKVHLYSAAPFIESQRGKGYRIFG